MRPLAGFQVFDRPSGIGTDPAHHILPARQNHFTPMKDIGMDAASRKDDAPLLSICIPTFDREPFLSDLLDSIVGEVTSLSDSLGRCAVEVVVSDNASTDGTRDLVLSFGDRLNVTYACQETNIGPDRNYLAAVDLAHGRFCWLMGSDDVIEPNGLAHVLRRLTQWDVAGLSVNYLKLSSDLKTRSTIRPPVPYTSDVVVDGWEEIYRNFASHFGFISGHVFRRDLWQSVVRTGKPLSFLNGYVHVFVMGKLLQQFPRWGYVHDICVGWRGRNDSFATGDHVNRMMIDVTGYRTITEELFGKRTATASAVMNQVAGTHILVHYRVAKVFYHSGASLRSAAATLAREYWRYPSFWTKLLPWIVLPAPVLHCLWIGYQRARNRFDPRFRIHPQARKRRLAVVKRIDRDVG